MTTILETGSVVLDTNDANITYAAASASVTFSRIYDNPVVVAYIATDGGGEDIDARITNLTGSGGDIFIHEPDHAGHNTETVVYVVAEEGVHETPEGHRIEAGVHQTKTSHEDGESFNGNRVPFLNDWSAAPVVFSTPNTHNNADWATTGLESVDTGGFDVAQQRGGSSSTVNTVAIEELGWIAVENVGVSTLDGAQFEVGTTTATSKTWASAFSLSPDVLVESQTRDGTNSGWSRGYGITTTDHNWQFESSSTGQTHGYLAIDPGVLVSGYDVGSHQTGTFYYNATTDSDTAAYGYDGLDANGNPKGNGGTYAGVATTEGTVFDQPPAETASTTPETSTGSGTTTATGSASATGIDVTATATTSTDVVASPANAGGTMLSTSPLAASTSIVTAGGALAGVKHAAGGTSVTATATPASAATSPSGGGTTTTSGLGATISASTVTKAAVGTATTTKGGLVAASTAPSGATGTATTASGGVSAADCGALTASATTTTGGIGVPSYAEAGNLLANPSFEADTVDTDQPTAWTSVPDTWADVNTRYAYQGTKSFGNHYHGEEVGSETTRADVWPNNYHYQDISVAGGEQLVAHSVVLNRSWSDGSWTGTDPDLQYVYEDDHRLHLYAYDSSDTLVAEETARWSGDAINRGLATRSGGWVFNSLELAVPDSAVRVRYQIDGGDGNNGYIDPETGHGGNAGIYMDSARLYEATYPATETAVASGGITGTAGTPATADGTLVVTAPSLTTAAATSETPSSGHAEQTASAGTAASTTSTTTPRTSLTAAALSESVSALPADSGVNTGADSVGEKPTISGASLPASATTAVAGGGIEAVAGQTLTGELLATVLASGLPESAGVSPTTADPYISYTASGLTATATAVTQTPRTTLTAVSSPTSAESSTGSGVGITTSVGGIPTTASTHPATATAATTTTTQAPTTGATGGGVTAPANTTVSGTGTTASGLTTPTPGVSDAASAAGSITTSNTTTTTPTTGVTGGVSPTSATATTATAAATTNTVAPGTIAGSLTTTFSTDPATSSIVAIITDGMYANGKTTTPDTTVGATGIPASTTATPVSGSYSTAIGGSVTATPASTTAGTGSAVADAAGNPVAVGASPVMATADTTTTSSGVQTVSTMTQTGVGTPLAESISARTPTTTSTGVANGTTTTTGPGIPASSSLTATGSGDTTTAGVGQPTPTTAVATTPRMTLTATTGTVSSQGTTAGGTGSAHAAGGEPTGVTSTPTVASAGTTTTGGGSGSATTTPTLATPATTVGGIGALSTAGATTSGGGESSATGVGTRPPGVASTITPTTALTAVGAPVGSTSTSTPGDGTTAASGGTVTASSTATKTASATTTVEVGGTPESATGTGTVGHPTTTVSVAGTPTPAVGRGATPGVHRASTGGSVTPTASTPVGATADTSTATNDVQTASAATAFGASGTTATAALGSADNALTKPTVGVGSASVTAGGVVETFNSLGQQRLDPTTATTGASVTATATATGASASPTTAASGGSTVSASAASVPGFHFIGWRDSGLVVDRDGVTTQGGTVAAIINTSKNDAETNDSKNTVTLND